MKRVYLSIVALCVWAFCLHAQSGEFDPASLDDPQGQGEVIRNHQVTVYTSPSVGGFVNRSSFYMAEGAQERIYAYPNAGYEFVGWMQNNTLFSSRNPLLIEMVERDLDYTAVFSFNPESPADPDANSWDSSTGTLLVDRFTAGRLSSTISNLLGDNSYTLVQSVTIIGQITDGDVGVFQSMSSCGHIDISRTNGISTIPQWAFANLTSLHTLILPASIELIEKNAFYGTTAIGELVLCATVPPDVEDNALDDLASTTTVRVPASALNIYSQSPLWSRFNLVAMDAQTLTVALPQDAQDGRYKNASLELVNLQSGQTQRYLITDRTEYTFLNLFQNSNYSLSVKNSRGMVLGTIDNIIIEDQDLSLAFDSLLMPQTLTLKIVTPEGEDVTTSATITWLDDKGNYLQKGAVLTNVIEGVEVYYTIDLEAKYNSIYEELPKESVVVNSEQKVKEIQLTKRQSIILSGKVVSSTSLSPVKGVYVSIAQSLKGKNTNVYFAETDNEGNFSVEVLKANTTLYFTDYSYLKHTLIVDTTQLGYLDTIKIQPLTGTTFFVIPQYTESVLRGNEQEVTDYYADYANVDFSVYNVTQQKSMQAVVKYPLLTLPEKIALGDSLAVTATSRNHKFYPSTIGTRIDSSLYARVNIPITQLGAIKATYQQADVDEVAALLFDNQGNLVKKKLFDGRQEVTFDDIDDGNYTVVCLENLKPFNGISRLSEFNTSALIEGNDYLQNTVTVNQGWISGMQFDSISAIDRALLYGGTNMRFTSSSTQVIVGNYVTLKAQIDFKHNSLNDISDVCLVFDLPESTEFVNGSVMVGGKVCNNYTLSNGRLIVPIQNTNQQIAFCITPLQEGIYTPCAYAQFKVSNADLQIPIASTYYEVKGLTLNVPNVSASKTIKAGGTAIPNSTVEVYADDELIGTAQSLGNGSWSADCTFRNPTNYAIMKVYASSVDKNGVKHISETYDCQYDQDAIEVSKVTMYHYNSYMRHTYEVIFDFQNPNNKPANYYYYIQKKFDFDIDFTNNDPSTISNVNLHIKTSSGNINKLEAQYNDSTKKWKALYMISSYDYGSLPINVSVTYSILDKSSLDGNRINAYIRREINNSLYHVEHISSSLFALQTVIPGNDTLYYIRYKLPIAEKEELSLRLENTDFEVQYIDGNLEFSESYSGQQILLTTQDSVYLYTTLSGTDHINFQNYIQTITTNNPAPHLSSSHPKKIKQNTCDYPEPLVSNRLQRGLDDGPLRQWTDLARRCFDNGDCLSWNNKDCRLADAVQRLRCSYGAKLEMALSTTYSMLQNTEKPDGIIDALHGTYEMANSVADIASLRESLEGLQNSNRQAMETILECARDCNVEPEDNGGDDSGESGNENCRYTLDPAGFVYEAVEQNRVEGVTATIYYKDTVRNEFGEVAEAEIVWDASEFEQENPQITDAEGKYQWFVPQGLWQVRFEKEGYEPTQSEWLPVPPPQLEVNIPIVQLRQPEVANAIAHKDAIDITFDKYMMPSLLNTGNIFVTANDQTIAGTIVMLDEQHPYDNTETSYASKVRFVPAAPFTASEITLTVSTRVHSYADVPLAQTFQQTFDVEDATVIEPAQTPDASIAAGTEVELGTQVTLSCATEGAVIRYTMDGSEPDCKTGYIYSAPIVLYGNRSVTVKAIACADGFDPSEVATFTYVISTDTHISACGTDGHAHVYVKGGILHVEGLTSPAQVYSAQGMLLMTVTNGTYRLPAGGMYLIRHDKGVKKIVF